MKNTLKALLLTTALILPIAAHAEDMRMCEPGTHCPMMEKLGGMQKQMGDMMNTMHNMMEKPCDESMKKDINGMIMQMQGMHEHMGGMVGMMGGKGMMHGAASGAGKAEEKSDHEAHH